MVRTGSHEERLDRPRLLPERWIKSMREADADEAVDRPPAHALRISNAGRAGTRDGSEPARRLEGRDGPGKDKVTRGREG